MHAEREARRERSAVLAPANLQPAVVERKTLVRGNLEEREGRCGVDERNELKECLVSTTFSNGGKS